MELKKSVFMSVMLMIMGIMSAQAQNAASETMDERFNGEGMPYGWFAKGWTVKEGAVQKGGNSGGMQMPGMPGGSSEVNYLMTPPLQASEGGSLVFSAKKGQDNGMGAMMGNSDSTFVVEYEVYSEHRWKRLAEFTTELEDDYKTFTVQSPGTGEYRFRFKASGNVVIDSVAGFKIDTEAPDIHVLRDSVDATNVDLSICEKDSVVKFSVINTGTGVLNTTIEVYDESPFSLNVTNLSVEAGDSTEFELTYSYQKAKTGRNSTELSFKPADNRIFGVYYRVDAVKAENNVWSEEFKSDGQPEGWFADGWQFKDNTASIIKPSDGMEGMMGGSSPSYYLLTPVLTVDNPQQTLVFKAMKTGSTGMGSMFGGGGPTFTIEKSVYGSHKWEKVKDLTEETDTLFKALWVSELPAGDYRFRFVASDSIVIDSVAGFTLKQNSPDIYVVYKDQAAQAINLGTLRADSTVTVGVINTGSGTLKVSVTSSDEQKYVVSQKELSVAAGDTAQVDVTYKYIENEEGERTAAITFKPAQEILPVQVVGIRAYTIGNKTWAENFEPEYVVEDESQPLDLPAGWESTGWYITKPSSGGGMMAMFGGGGGDETPKTWMATTDSEEYELVTPSLQATQGDILEFQAEMTGGGGMMAMFSGGGGSTGLLNVYYNCENSDEWVLYDTYTTTGTVHFKAPFSGIYRLKFKGSSVALDDFCGFRHPTQGIALRDGMDAQNKEVLDTYSGVKVNVYYDRVLSAVDNGDGTWTPKAHTICLPYTVDFKAYNEAGKVKLYAMQFLDKYYNHLIFNELKGETAKAGVPYLVVVNEGEVNLNAYDVEPVKELDSERNKLVMDYEYWHSGWTPQILRGLWEGTFETLPVNGEDAAKTYCLADDGSWVKLSTATADVPGFRAFFADRDYELPDKIDPQTSRASRAGKLSDSYKTKFYINGEAGNGEGDVEDIIGLAFSGDVTRNAPDVTGIKPTIQTIDNDGSVRYYDLHGRLLKEKPAKGIYIENGVKKIK